MSVCQQIAEESGNINKGGNLSTHKTVKTVLCVNVCQIHGCCNKQRLHLILWSLSSCG